MKRWSIDYKLGVNPIENMNGAFYRVIDVDPVLAAKNAEIERLTNENRGWVNLCDIKREEIGRLKSSMGEMVANTLALQDGSLYNQQRQHISELEAELRQQKDECERFHKPA